MKRVYRLLRNNEESGPFTIGELLGQNLRPTDMLWIEGRSTAWCYLSEIELFPSAEPEISSGPVITEKTDDIETRADEIRKKVLGFKPQQLPVRKEKGEQGEKHYYIPVTPLDTIEIVDHRRKRSSMPTDILMTLVIIGLFAGGLYGGRALFLNKKQQPPSSVIQSVTRDEHAAKAAPAVNHQPFANIATVDSAALLAFNKQKTAAQKPNDRTRQSKRMTTIITRSTQTATTGEQTDAQLTVSNEPDAKKSESEPVREVKPVSISNDEIAKDDTQEKKQNLFKKLFGKKKKTEREEN